VLCKGSRGGHRRGGEKEGRGNGGRGEGSRSDSSPCFLLSRSYCDSGRALSPDIPRRPRLVKDDPGRWPGVSQETLWGFIKTLPMGTEPIGAMNKPPCLVPVEIRGFVTWLPKHAQSVLCAYRLQWQLARNEPFVLVWGSLTGVIPVSLLESPIIPPGSGLE
jgi:hypothetical protein